MDAGGGVRGWLWRHIKTLKGGVGTWKAGRMAGDMEEDVNVERCKTKY